MASNKNPARISRREFLKLAALTPLAALVNRFRAAPPRGFSEAEYSSFQQNASQGADPAQPNIILVLFDSLTARNMSLYGYPRQTTPNLARFAENALVYHAHHSPANYTTPSTASLLTGAYPWAHRAYQPGGLIQPQPLIGQNLFNQLGNTYQRLAFAQNVLADVLMIQCEQDLEQRLGAGSFSLVNQTFYDHLLSNDRLLGYRSAEDFVFAEVKPNGSLYLSLLGKITVLLRQSQAMRKYGVRYPRGLPILDPYYISFLLEAVMDGAIETLQHAPSPFCAYLHFFPPHHPYCPSEKFIGAFQDDYQPPAKPARFFSQDITPPALARLRMEYDESIAHVDAEFGRLLDFLQQSGLAKNSAVIVASDHGELFEREVHGHVTPLLYEALLHVPLLISTPGQSGRQDIFTPTSTVDLLPTLLHLAGKGPNDALPGRLLPGLGGQEDPTRSLFAVEAKPNSSHAPLKHGTLAIIKEGYKLIHYRGYAKLEDASELYDLKNDPEELEDLAASQPGLARDLLAEIDQEIEQANQALVKRR